eukprot:scaffold122235_cov85-Phaeocystis_antarctica.AAC.1
MALLLVCTTLTNALSGTEKRTAELSDSDGHPRGPVVWLGVGPFGVAADRRLESQDGEDEGGEWVYGGGEGDGGGGEGEGGGGE